MRRRLTQIGKMGLPGTAVALLNVIACQLHFNLASASVLQVVSELGDLPAKTQTPEEQELLSKIESMAKRARDETHPYLKFIGD